MELAIVVIISVLTAAITARVSSRRSGDPKKQESILLPAPGSNLELYTRVKELFDTLTKERDEAREESARLRAQLADAEVKFQADLAEATAERDRVTAKLKASNDVLKVWTHAKMDVSFDRVGLSTKTVRA